MFFRHRFYSAKPRNAVIAHKTTRVLTAAPGTVHSALLAKSNVNKLYTEPSRTMCSCALPQTVPNVRLSVVPITTLTCSSDHYRPCLVDVTCPLPSKVCRSHAYLSFSIRIFVYTEYRGPRHIVFSHLPMRPHHFNSTTRWRQFIITNARARQSVIF